MNILVIEDEPDASAEQKDATWARRGKGTKIMVIADRTGLPVAITIASASLYALVEQTLKASVLPDQSGPSLWRCRGE